MIIITNNKNKKEHRPGIDAMIRRWETVYIQICLQLLAIFCIIKTEERKKNLVKNPMKR